MQSNKSKTKPKASQFSFEAIGTLWTIEIFESVSSPEKILKAVLNRIDTFDKNYSRFRSDSFVTQVSKTTGKYTLPDDAKPMMDLYLRLYQLTHGLMTPLIGQLVSDAGYDADYSFIPEDLPETPKWDDAIEYCFPDLLVKQHVLLDLGACGKGYLVDIIGDVLHSHGISRYCINAGGDLLVGNREVEVALEHPLDTSKAIGIAKLHNASLCGSAGNRRKWAGYTHIFDPYARASPTHIQAVWVSADSAMLADALTTALHFLLPEQLNKHYTFEYAIVHANGSLTYSGNFPAQFFK